MPALSICLATNAPPERVAATLAPLRELDVDGSETVLALDDRVDPALDARYATLVDRIVRFPYADPPVRIQPLLYARCRGRWILRLDADEVPAPTLAQDVAAVVDDPALTHAWIRRAWLWPDAGTFLAQWPWDPDYQLRLSRNDPAVVRVPAVVHGYLEAEGARRYLRSPIYHADLLMNDAGARLEKARRYEALRPGLRIAGREFNRAYYLPEEHGVLRTAPVPAADQPAIDRLLAPGPAPEPAGAGAGIEHVGRAQVDALWSAAPLAEDDYRAHIELLDADLRIHLGEVRTFDVRVHNRGVRRWPWGQLAPIRIAQRWRLPDGTVVEGLRTSLPHAVEPGGATIVPAQVCAPPAAGRCELEIDLVHEHVRWFGAAVLAIVECVPAQSTLSHSRRLRRRRPSAWVRYRGSRS